MTEDKLPALRIINFVNGSTVSYTSDREVTYDNLIKFIQEYKSGLINPQRITEKVRNQYSGRIVETSLSGFSERVINNKKHVLTFFLTEWCSATKKVFF